MVLSVHSQHDFIDSGAGVIGVCYSAGIQIGLGGGDGGCGGILTYVVQQTYLSGIRLCGEHQVYYSSGVKVVGGAGDVAAGSLERFHDAGGYGVGYGGEYYGYPVILGGGLHSHGNRGGNAYHYINAVCNEVGYYLVHKVGIGVAVVVGYVEGDAIFFAYLLEAGLYIVHDLVKRSVVNVVADTDLYFLAGFCPGGSLAAGGEAAECDKYGECQCDDLLHFVFLPFISLKL